MPFDWQQLLTVARLLDQEADKTPADAEALRRTAVGRAYYSAFCCVRNHAAASLGYRIRGNADDHAALRAHLKGKWKGVSDRLDRLRDLRNQADYQDNLPWASPKITITEAIDAAARVIASLPKS